jgi:serine protease Do
MVAGTVPNQEVSIKLMRNGKTETIRVKILEMTTEAQAFSKTFDNQLKGVYVQNITPDLKKSLDIPGRIKGVVITDVDEESPAEGILKKNDVIMEINRNNINNTKDYEEAVSRIKPADDILLLVFRQNSAFYITLSSR